MAVASRRPLSRRFVRYSHAATRSLDTEPCPAPAADLHERAFAPQHHPRQAHRPSRAPARAALAVPRTPSATATSAPRSTNQRPQLARDTVQDRCQRALIRFPAVVARPPGLSDTVATAARPVASGAEQVASHGCAAPGQGQRRARAVSPGAWAVVVALPGGSRGEAGRAIRPRARSRRWSGSGAGGAWPFGS